ncbi:ABC-type branched-subunit amino acid transport system ATPase component, partial [Roseovarius sp. MBR-51]
RNPKGQKWTTFTPPATTLCRRYRGRVLLRRSHAEQIANYDVNRKKLAQTMQDYLVANGLTPHEALNGLLA